MEKLEFPIYTAEGYEADDVLGAIANQTIKEDPEMNVMILTGDQDILQLIKDRISVYSPVNASKQPIIFDTEKFREKYGFDPIQMIEYKALRGDPSDNIPGVPGIGDVTATKLVQEFGTIDALYEAIKNGKTDTFKPAILKKLQENEESARLSHSLATIVTDVPVTYNAQECQMELLKPEKLISLFKELGFKSLMNDLPTSHKLLSEATDVFGSAPASEEAATEEPVAPAGPLSESEEMDLKLAPTLRKMEETGVKLDCGYLKDLEDEFTKELEKMRAKLYEWAGVEFNPDSPSQVAHTFYEVLQMPTTNVRKGKTGYTTDAATLHELAQAYRFAGLLLQYRELTKLLNTYVKPLQELVDENNRVHTSYAPDTSSGRISSRNPNLQNIPVKTEQGRRLRKAFVSEPGKVLVAADYSQIELRLAAHLSGDEVMKKAFNEHRDFHAETAERMQVDRRMAKIINFSILYGKGAFGFAVDMGITVPEARDYIEKYFKTFPKLREYLDQILKETREKGYAETLYGRKRAFPDITASNFQRRSAAEREAMNMPIQGSAADILKMAMYSLSKKLSDSKSPAKMILTVHDELVLEVPEKNVPEIAELLAKTMTEVATLSVPLEVTVKCGTNWAEMQPIESATSALKE
ncbi:MAG: polymerase protein [Patescibacteria group bacterium]|nr:polymerase protein [Patescibacteria group bacterium]